VETSRCRVPKDSDMEPTRSAARCSTIRSAARFLSAPARTRTPMMGPHPHDPRPRRRPPRRLERPAPSARLAVAAVWPAGLQCGRLASPACCARASRRLLPRRPWQSMRGEPRLRRPAATPSRRSGPAASRESTRTALASLGDGGSVAMAVCL
jgi:hypothetical protein